MSRRLNNNERGFFWNQATRVQEEQCGHYFQEYFKFLTLPSQFFSSWQVSFALVADLKMWWYFLDLKILTFLIFLYFWDILIFLEKWASLYVALNLSSLRLSQYHQYDPSSVHSAFFFRNTRNRKQNFANSQSLKFQTENW